jgi:hypothetical protein
MSPLAVATLTFSLAAVLLSLRVIRPAGLATDARRRLAAPFYLGVGPTAVAYVLFTAVSPAYPPPSPAS